MFKLLDIHINKTDLTYVQRILVGLAGFFDSIVYLSSFTFLISNAELNVLFYFNLRNLKNKS